MRRAVTSLLAFAIVGLCGCASMYDDAARDECDRTTTARDRGACYDRVDQHRRDRDARQ
jgi:hypothetical protein